MDIRLGELMGTTVPRMNHDLCSGIAEVQMKNVEHYLNFVMAGAAASCPEGLKYVDLRRCTPQEEFREITRALKPKRAYELSKSDVYMVKFMFTFKGVEMRPRYSLLPFVGPGGIIHLNGTQYKVSPVLGGRILNIDKNVVYLTTPKSPMAFDRTGVFCKVDGRTTMADAVHSKFYNMSKVDRPTKIDTTLMHYILAEYGLSVTLLKYFKVDAILIDTDPTDYINSPDYKVFSSTRLPALTKSMRQDTTCDISIIVPIANYTKSLDPIIGAVFYIMDQCSDSVQLCDVDDPELWLRLLYRFIFKKPDAPSTEHEKMVAHMDSVRHSLDPLTKELLMNEGILCNDIFELFTYMQYNLHDLIIHNDVGSMYDMELSTVKHLTYHIVCNINNVMYELKRLTGDRITEDNIYKIMNTSFHKDSIFTVSKHAELSSDDIASDCKPYGATCNIISQSKAATAGISQKHTSTLNDHSHLLHPSQTEVATYLMMSKAEPTGRGKGNPFLNMSGRHYVSARPSLEAEIEEFGKLIERD